MKYLTTSVWALSAAMLGGWMAYDYHVGVVNAYDAKGDRLRDQANYWHGEWLSSQLDIGYLKDKVSNPKLIINPDPMDATMKVMIEGGGHGSGTHIGGGFVITAGHVAEKEGDTLQAKFWDGGQHEAVTLWSSETYDVALLKIDGYTGAASHLDCRTPDVGEELTLTGNPMAMEFVQTYAKVSSRITDAYASSWAEALPVDGAMGPGMSGGGAFDKDGDLLGVNVGIPLAM